MHYSSAFPASLFLYDCTNSDAAIFIVSSCWSGAKHNSEAPLLWGVRNTYKTCPVINSHHYFHIQPSVLRKWQAPLMWPALQLQYDTAFPLVLRARWNGLKHSSFYGANPSLPSLHKMFWFIYCQLRDEVHIYTIFSVLESFRLKRLKQQVSPIALIHCFVILSCSMYCRIKIFNKYLIMDCIFHNLLGIHFSIFWFIETIHHRS